MIQRIQTVYWLASIAILAALIFLPLFAIADGNFMTTDCKALTITIISTTVLTLVNVFLFKNRKLQIRIGYALIFLHLLMYFFIVAHYFLDNGMQLSPWAGIPLVSLILQILAVRGVKKDEALIKSLDRLR